MDVESNVKGMITFFGWHSKKSAKASMSTKPTAMAIREPHPIEKNVVHHVIEENIGALEFNQLTLSCIYLGILSCHRWCSVI